MTMHTPVWDIRLDRWKCWTCGQLLIVCTKEELDYALGDSKPVGLTEFLTGKQAENCESAPPKSE